MKINKTKDGVWVNLSDTDDVHVYFGPNGLELSANDKDTYKRSKPSYAAVSFQNEGKIMVQRRDASDPSGVSINEISPEVFYVKFKAFLEDICSER